MSGKLESLQEDWSRTRQEIPQTACCKARACNCCVTLKCDDIYVVVSWNVFMSYEKK